MIHGVAVDTQEVLELLGKDWDIGAPVRHLRIRHGAALGKPKLEIAVRHSHDRVGLNQGAGGGSIFF
jgi:hypothetical protein